uniref:Uncharacterized protein n=1 Tax=Arion vulgaris TaxID=1028688 RepID=A0A0B6ZYD4_9EUPU
MVLGDIFRIKRTPHHHFPLHSTSINDFYHINEVLLMLETANKLCVIRASEKQQSTFHI